MMAYDDVTQSEAESMGRPPKEPTEVLGLRLPVSEVERLDKLLADKRLKGFWTRFGISNRSTLIRFLIHEGIGMQERAATDRDLKRDRRSR
jgi:hypothetical protein